jgi:hypothetical protein
MKSKNMEGEMTINILAQGYSENMAKMVETGRQAAREAAKKAVGKAVGKAAAATTAATAAIKNHTLLELLNMQEVDRDKIIASNKITSWNTKYPYTTNKGKQLLETEYADKKINKKKDDIKLSINSIKMFLERYEKTKMNIEINAELDKLTEIIKNDMRFLEDEISKFNASQAEAKEKAAAYKKEMAAVMEKAEELGLLKVLNQANVLKGLSVNSDIVVKSAVTFCETSGVEKVSDIAKFELTEDFVNHLSLYIKPIPAKRLTIELSNLSK